MLRPETIGHQYLGKAHAEASRGCGVWPLQPHPCELEPPWEPYYPRSVTVWDCVVNDWEGPWEGSWLRKLISSEPALYRVGEPPLLPELLSPGWDNLVPIVVEQFSEDSSTIPRMQQVLLALPTLHHPLSFEVIGQGAQPKFDAEKCKELLHARSNGEKHSMREAICGWYDPYTAVQFVAHKADAATVQSQLVAHYPNSAIVIGDGVHMNLLSNEVAIPSVQAATLYLESHYCHPLRIFGKLDPDPLGVAIAAMEELDKEQWALLQVLFQPTRASWAETLTASITDPYNPKQYMLADVPERTLREKFSTPLFSVSVRIMASNRTAFRQLEGWAEQFAAPPQRLELNKFCWEDGCMPGFERELLGMAVDDRCTHRPGILLNLNELASLVHLPSEAVASDRLRRVNSRTRPAMETVAAPGSVVLGENVHRGKKRIARIPVDLRSRHCYVAGASGTGKSTLLLNMILQDIDAGHGVGLLDPHGDLIKAVLRRIPEHRVDDVILFNPADDQYPISLNVLEAHGDTERERVVNETVTALKRQFPSSWGPRLEQILHYTIQTVLHAIEGATLADVHRMLTDLDFRAKVVSQTQNSWYLQFWNHEMAHQSPHVVEPVLNKLSLFLMTPMVRNIVCQRHSTVNFDDVLNHNKIFLANLSTGLLTEKNAGVLGSFVVTKIVNSAFRRASIPEAQRQPWYLYVDEFQAFMDLSLGFDRILAEARKYRLVLAGLANQYVGQLSPEVRAGIFGNVGVMVTFRLGVSDAHSIANEMGVFTPEEIMSLELGEALVRAGGSRKTYNINHFCPINDLDISGKLL